MFTTSLVSRQICHALCLIHCEALNAASHCRLRDLDQVKRTITSCPCLHVLNKPKQHDAVDIYLYSQWLLLCRDSFGKTASSKHRCSKSAFSFQISPFCRAAVNKGVRRFQIDKLIYLLKN